MVKYIIYVETGLCNTIKSIISLLRIYEKNNMNDKILLYNKKNEYVNNGGKDAKLLERLPGSFKEIFDNVEEVSNIKKNLSHIKIRTWRITTFPEDNLKDSIFYKDCNDKYRNKCGNIDLLFEKTPDNMKDIIIKQLNKLIINKDILNYVNNYQKKYFTKKTISVQANPTRIYTLKHGINWKVKNFVEEMREKDSFIYKIIDEMKKFDEEYNFFLSLSYIDFIDIFIEEFGKERILYTPFPQKRTFKDDMIDLLLLSKNDVIIGTHMSTFCEVAWYYSNCESQVIIVK